MATEKGGVHVLLVSLSMQGHLSPTLMLAKLLLSKGLHVTLATTDLARKMFHNGNTSSTTNSNLNIEFFSDGFDEDFDRDKNVDHYFKSLPIYTSRNFSELLEKLLKVRKISCIIMNTFDSWLADVATRHEIPCAMLWIQPCANYSIYYRFYKNLNTFPTLENHDIPIDLPGIPLLDVDEMPTFIHPSNPLPSFRKGLADMIQSLDKVKWVLGNSFYELENDIIDSMQQHCPIIPIGPLVPPGMLGKEDFVEGGIGICKAEDTCLDWLNNQPPSSVVYISFGSMVVFPNKQMEEIALALKSSRKPFVWVVRPRNIAKDGMGEVPSWFVEESKEQGLVIPWCTQTKVLAHPSIACFMSHCGWNSLLEALVSGVPVIGLPRQTDQPMNAKLLTHLFKTGVKARCLDGEGVVGKEEVERCILEIMEGTKAEDMKIRAAKMKEAAWKAVADGGFSDRNIQMFIDNISKA